MIVSWGLHCGPLYFGKLPYVHWLLQIHVAVVNAQIHMREHPSIMGQVITGSEGSRPT